MKAKTYRLVRVAVALAAATLAALPPTAALAGAPPRVSPAPAGPTSTPAPGSAGNATFGIQPVTAGKPDTRTSLVYGVTSGATLDDRVAVVNYSLHALTLDVYAADAINDADGNLTLPPAGQRPVDAGSWITLGGKAASGHLRIKSQSYVIVPIQVRVPSTASPGDHAAGVVASLTASSRGKKLNVTLHQRVGVRVFFRVAGTVTPKLSIEGLSVDYHNNLNPVGSGSATVSYRVHNTGNVDLGAKQRVDIDGLFGQTAQATPADVPLLLPGSSVTVRVPLRGVLPEFLLTATVHLTPVVPPGNVDTGLHQYSASTHFWAVPWTLIAVVIALGGAVFWFVRWRRKLRGATGRHSAGRNGVSAASLTPKEKVRA